MQKTYIISTFLSESAGNTSKDHFAKLKATNKKGGLTIDNLIPKLLFLAQHNSNGNTYSQYFS